MRKTEFVKGAYQVHRHAAENENVDNGKQQPKGMRGFSADQFAPFHEIDTRNQSFYSRNSGFGKKEIQTDAQEDIRDNQENENAHNNLILL
jgi:hypothetical protein